MATYDRLIQEVEERSKVWRETCSNYVPKLYEALTREEHLDPSDAKARIEKDCVKYWALKTIRDNLPAECKDAAKAEGGRKGGTSRKKDASNVEASFEEQKKIVVGAGGSSIEDQAKVEVEEEKKETLQSEPVTKTIADIVTPQKTETSMTSYEQDVTQELLETQAALNEKEKELEEVRGEVKKLSQAITALTSNVKNSPAFKDMQEQMKAIEKENEELRNSIAQATQFTSAKEQEAQLYEGTIPNAKLSELFVVIRSSITKKRDVRVRFSADRRFLFAQGVNPE